MPVRWRSREFRRPGVMHLCRVASKVRRGRLLGIQSDRAPSDPAPVFVSMAHPRRGARKDG